VFPGKFAVDQFDRGVASGRVRRAKLYYLRGLKGKSARLKRVERVDIPATAPAEENRKFAFRKSKS